MDTISRLRNHMEFLKLYRMRDALDTELAEAEKQNLGAPAVMERLFSTEAAALTERRIDRRIRESKLDERKLLEDFAEAENRSIPDRGGQIPNHVTGRTRLH